MRLRLRPALGAALGALALGRSPAAHAQGAVPTPASVLGWDPGTDRKLPEWRQVVAYFQALDAASPRITVRTLGKTTLGRPFIAAFIGDSETVANLPRYQELQRRLADPRVLAPGELQRVLADDKVVVLVTSGIHSTEVGGNLSPMKIAERLVGAEDEEARSIRRNALVIMVPSLNPDGVDIVGDWYRSSLGTAWEGTQPPQLYHHYTGHDDNRDWYAFTQAETRMVIDSLYSQWHPQVVNDIHQQGSNGSRIFIPPYMDPIEPNIDPILMAGVAQMGKSMTWRLTSQGFAGVANNTSYDAWTPARAYQHYHGAIRILTETASAQLATPIDSIPFASLRPGYNVDPKVTGVDFLTTWPGGRWTVGDIVRYQTAATWALLAQAADDRALWLSSYAQVERNAVMGNRAPGRADWPATIVIPPQAPRDTAVNAALRILQRGQVEVRRASAPFSAGGRSYPAGSLVIYTAQPYGAFAKALLEPQRYPNLREYPGGPPKRPYDVTAHTLPLLYGFDVAFVKDSVTAPTALVATQGQTPWVARGLTDGKARRVAVFANYAASMDEGWTRWLLDQYRVPFTVVHAQDLRAGNLSGKYDAIILPEQNARLIANGPVGAYPDSLRGGVGAEGAAALRAFVEAGGTLLAFNDASDYAIEALELPVKNVLAGLRNTEFYAPGSIFRAEFDAASPLAAGLTAPVQAVWFEDSPAFEVTDPSRAMVVARYPAQGDPLLSGWLLGGEKLNGKAAMVDVRQGKGHVVLFGFRPQYRGQSMATFPLIWNALRAMPAGGQRVTKAATH